MKLNFQAGSSPLASRHNPVIYSAIFVGIIIIFIAIIIWFLLKKLDTLHQTEEWIEKQKDLLRKVRLRFLNKVRKSKVYKDLLLIYKKGPIKLTESMTTLVLS